MSLNSPLEQSSLEPAPDWRERYRESVYEIEALEQRHSDVAAQGMRMFFCVSRLCERLSERGIEVADVPAPDRGSDFDASVLKELMAFIDEIATGEVDEQDDDRVDPDRAAAVVAQFVQDLQAQISTLVLRHPQNEELSVLAQRLDELEHYQETSAVLQAAVSTYASALVCSVDSVIERQRLRLSSLIDLISLPVEAHDRAVALQEELAAAQSDEQVTRAAKRLALTIDDVIGAQQQKVDDLGGFLADVLGQLAELQQHLAFNREDLGEAQDNRDQLDNALQAGLEQMRAEVQDSTDVESLKAHIRSNIEAIDATVNEFKQSEASRAHRAEQALREASEQLQSLTAQTNRLRKELENAREQALRDPLTEVPNRLAFNEFIAYTHARWERQGGDLCLAIVDIDYFKRINDTLGHPAGDKVLKTLANRMHQLVRKQDFFGRLGGEEFILVLPETNLEGAMVVAQKLRSQVERCNFRYRDTRVPVTVSCGVAQFRTGESTAEVYDRADKMLYDAKQAGRNCCRA